MRAPWPSSSMAESDLESEPAEARLRARLAACISAAASTAVRSDDTRPALRGSRGARPHHSTAVPLAFQCMAREGLHMATKNSGVDSPAGAGPDEQALECMWQHGLLQGWQCG